MFFRNMSPALPMWGIKPKQIQIHYKFQLNDLNEKERVYDYGGNSVTANWAMCTNEKKCEANIITIKSVFKVVFGQLVLTGIVMC